MINNGKIGVCDRNNSMTTSIKQFKPKAHHADLAADGRIRLNGILQKWYVRM
jgi:hypothetical protein